MSPDTHSALVIGGGIAGPVAAMALLKAGIRPTVYEAYADDADSVGGALTIAPNGQNALAAIGLTAPAAGSRTSRRNSRPAGRTGRRTARRSSPSSAPPSPTTAHQPSS